MICTPQTFIPQPWQAVRWLCEESDYELAADFWARVGSPLARETWQQAIRQYRFRYAGVIHENTLLAIASLIPYSPVAWELGAVGTDEPYRHQGYGKQVTAFVTAGILAEVPIATCTTDDNNQAMIQTALSIGYRMADKEETERYGILISEYFREVDIGIT
jgi:GNAT superfamily N-acetyltransferase